MVSEFSFNISLQMKIFHQDLSISDLILLSNFKNCYYKNPLESLELFSGFKIIKKTKQFTNLVLSK